MEKTVATILIMLCGAIFGQNSFPEKLEELGEFRRAAVEYLRIAHEEKDSKASSRAVFRAARCFEREGDYWKSRRLYLELDSPLNSQKIRESAYYRVGVSDFFLGRLDEIERRVSTAEGSDSLIDALGYLSGWTLFFAREYSISRDIFAELKPELYENSPGFMLDRSEDGLELRRRSPLLSASMSAILPGSGRAYCGRWGDALVNLIVVGASAGGSVALWESDREFALTLGVLSAFFYAGNVYGSYVGAKWFNEQQHRELYRYARQEVSRRPEDIFDN
jgi:hypothetical protein